MTRFLRMTARSELACVAAAALAAEALLPLRTGLLTSAHPSFPKPWDHSKYIYMAAHPPLDFHIAPFCWRIATPWLAAHLPARLEASFFLIAFVSLALTGVAIYYLARALGFARASAAAGMAMFFSLGWAPKFALWDFWLPDGASFLLIAVAIYAIAAGRDLVFVAALTAGVLVKESVLFVAPLAYTLRAKGLFDRARAIRVVACAAPAMIVLAALHLGHPPRNSDLAYWRTVPAGILNSSDTLPYDLARLFGYLGLRRAHEFSLDVIPQFTIGTFGVMVFALPFFALRQNWPLFARFSPFLALVYAQVLFAENTERLLVAGFPALIILALNGLERIGRGVDAKRTWLLTAVPLSFCALTALHAPLGQPPAAIEWPIFAGWVALLSQLRPIPPAG